MKNKPFVPLEKSSKKVRRDFNKKLRGSWGVINPITRKTPNLKAFNRKKIHKGDANEQNNVDF